MKPTPYKLFNLQTILLVPLGILLNFLLAQLVLRLSLPIFLDSIGTIFVSAVGGLLPGIMVGFFSNAINSIGDPITLYYSVISVLFAMLTVVFSKKRVFRSFLKSLLTAIPFAIIGGILGSFLTWALSGLTLGSGVSSPYAVMLINRYGLRPFSAQLIADFSIDIVDKLITVIIVFLAIKCIPQKLLKHYPYGDLYTSADVSGNSDQH